MDNAVGAGGPEACPAGGRYLKYFKPLRLPRRSWAARVLTTRRRASSGVLPRESSHLAGLHRRRLCWNGEGNFYFSVPCCAFPTLAHDPPPAHPSVGIMEDGAVLLAVQGGELSSPPRPAPPRLQSTCAWTGGSWVSTMRRPGVPGLVCHPTPSAFHRHAHPPYILTSRAPLELQLRPAPAGGRSVAQREALTECSFQRCTIGDAPPAPSRSKAPPSLVRALPRPCRRAPLRRR